MTRLSGANVVAVTATAWREADQSRCIEGCRVVGRAVVAVEGGGRFNGLVIRRRVFDTSSGGGPVDRDAVVVWERDGTPEGVFRALPVVVGP
jgi:hypothetical protein